MSIKSLQIVFFLLLTSVFQINLQANTTKNCHNFSMEVPCDEVYSPGQISANQTICLDDNVPAPLTSLEDANNGIGQYEYMWIKTTVNPTSPSVVWLSIPGATNASYSPPALVQTTWYRRCTRPVGCVAYGAESDDVKITIESCVDPCEEFKANIINKISPTCHDNADGLIELSIEGGAAPFSINWIGNNATGLIAGNLTIGVYTVEITDANGCYDSKLIELSAPEALKVNAFKGDATCFESNNGWITLSVDGGTAPYTYIYNDIETTNNELQNLAGGVYEILVIDNNGCRNTTTIEVFEPAKIELTATTTPETCLQNDGSIQINVEGGLAPYDFQWDNDETTQDLNDLIAGNYFLVVNDRNDCAEYLEVTVADDCAPLAINFEETMLYTLDKNTVKIGWMAENETPDGVFLVERSIDGENFEIVGDPISGTTFSSTGNAYHLMDNDPKAGLNHYKICHFDNEGNISFSKVNSLFFANEATPEISVYPNPVANELHFDFLHPTESEVTIQLTDAYGKMIVNKVIEKGLRFDMIDVANLPAGTYFAQIVQENSYLTKKIIKE